MNPTQDCSKHLPRHRHLGKLEDHIPRVLDDLRADLDQLLLQRCQRPVPGALPPSYSAG